MYIAHLSGYANFHAFPFIELGLPPPMADRYRIFIYLGLLSLSIGLAETLYYTSD
jgi:hypothetical protein